MKMNTCLGLNPGQLPCNGAKMSIRTRVNVRKLVSIRYLLLLFSEREKASMY